MNEVRRKIQVEWEDCDRDNCKCMRRVFYKHQSLLKEDIWHLKRYTERYGEYFDWVKTTT